MVKMKFPTFYLYDVYFARGGIAALARAHTPAAVSCYVVYLWPSSQSCQR